MTKRNQDHNQPTPPDSDTTDDAPVFLSLTKESLIELLREARRDPQLEVKLEAEAKRVARRREQMVQIAKQDERARASRQASCAHRKPNGEETSGGQEFSDGRVRIFCLRCQKMLRAYWSPSVAQGMAIQNKMTELGITDAELAKSMEFEGEGNPMADLHDDFVLGMPRRPHTVSVTTES